MKICIFWTNCSFKSNNRILRRHACAVAILPFDEISHYGACCKFDHTDQVNKITDVSIHFHVHKSFEIAY